MAKLFSIKITEKNLMVIRTLATRVREAVVNVILSESENVARDIKSKYFTSSFGAYSPGSDLQDSIKSDKVSVSGGGVSGGILLGTTKTKAFISEHGETRTISPKKAKALAIPTTKAAYQIQKGVKSLRDIPALKRVRGGLDYDTKTTGKPMFVFKNSITIKPKIDVDQIVTQYHYPVMVAIRAAIYDVLSRG